MIHFGFSYIGLLYLVMLFVPNFIWTKYKPTNYEVIVKEENKILLWFERIGEVLVCGIVIMFSEFNLKPINVWSI